MYYGEESIWGRGDNLVGIDHVDRQKKMVEFSSLPGSKAKSGKLSINKFLKLFDKDNDKKKNLRNKEAVIAAFEASGKKIGEVVKRIRFETSKGFVEAAIVTKLDNGIWDCLPYYEVNEVGVLDKENTAILNSLYDTSSRPVSIVDDTWINIELDDRYYGSPEYKYEVIG